MNSSVINSSLPFNHTSSGSSLPLSNASRQCSKPFWALSLVFIERSTNLVVGYPANIIVMCLVAKEKSDSSTSNIFIFNLAIADAFLGVMSFIWSFGTLVLGSSYFGNIMWFTSGIKNSSPLFLTCICLDRYVAVVHPIVFTSIKDKKIRVASSMLVWGLMIAYAILRPLLAKLSAYIYIGLILASFMIMVFCNFSIMWSLKKSVLGKEKMHPMKKKALRTVQIYLAVIVIHYLPTVAIIPFYSNPFPRYCLAEMLVFTLMYFSATIAPFLYIFRNKQLSWLKNLFCICCRSPSPE